MNRPVRIPSAFALVAPLLLAALLVASPAVAQDEPEADAPAADSPATDSPAEAAEETADGQTPAPLPATVALEIVSTPPGAAISINGRRLGVTPTTLQMPPGPVTVEVELGGYIDWSETVELGVDGHTITVELEPAGEEGPTP